MSTLSQIADIVVGDAHDKKDEERIEFVISALLSVPWNCPSEINEQLAKSMVRKYVLEEDGDESNKAV